jgi:sulfite oxidase
VYKINVLKEPSMGPVQRQEYLYYNQQMGKHNVKYSNGFSIQAMPVSSAIMSPGDKQVIIHDGSIHLEGWAYSGNGNWPERVEISPDGYVVVLDTRGLFLTKVSVVTCGTRATRRT